MRYEIDTTKILNQLLRYVWVMILAFAIGATSGYFYVNNVKDDTYTSKISLVVNGKTDDPSGLAVAQNIIKTAVTVMRSERFIQEKILDDRGINDLTVSQVVGMTRFSIEEDSLIAYIRVTSSDAETAYRIADAFYKADYAFIAETVKGCTISPIDEPKLPESPNAKNSTYMAFIIGIVSAIGSAVLIVLFTVLDTRIKSEDDLASLRGDVPLVGIIPSFNQTGSGYGRYGRYGRREYGYSYGYNTIRKSNDKSDKKTKGEAK